MSHQSNVNAGDLPNSYQPAPPVQNFAAPAHHLSTEQSKEVVALAEQSHQDTQGGFMSQNSGSGHHGGNSGFGSSTTDNIASTLGGGSGSATRSHGLTGGEYERRGDDLTGNRTNLSSGTGQLGSSTYDNNTSSSSHSHGLGSGAGAGALGAAGAGAGAGVYGAGHGSHGDSNARGGASAVAAKQSGKGGELTDHEFRNTAPQGTLENKLQDELERNARKAGTHATGFGVQGTPAGSSSLGSGASSGLTGNTSSSTTGAGYGTSGQQYGSQSGTGIGHHSSTSGAAPLAGAGVGAAGAGYGTSSGLTGQQGYGQQQQGYPAGGASTAVGQTGTTGTGERLADQIHGLGTQRDVDVGKFGTMQDHTRKNNEL